MTDFLLLQLLYDALVTPNGVVVETPDPEFLRQKLYPIRKREPQFTSLAFVISPINGLDLWILNKGASNGT